MIHSRGALLSKATGGNFAADKTLTDEIVQHEFRSIYELTAFVREWNETNPPLTGISFDSDKITFDGFGQAEDADHVHTFIMGQTILGKISASAENKSADETSRNEAQKSAEKGLKDTAFVIGLDGTTADGSVPYEILKRQLAFMR